MASVTCQKQFTLVVDTCAFSCLRLSDVLIPATDRAQWTAYAANAGLIFGGGGDSINPAVIQTINPDTGALGAAMHFGVLQIPDAGIYHPFTERLITAHFTGAASTTLRVINPLTLSVDDTATVAGQTPKLATDEVNNRVYLGTNSFPCAAYSFDVVTHVATLVATGSTTLGAIAYSGDDDYIFFAGDANSIRVIDAATFGLVTTISVIGGNATSIAYCPDNRCLYAVVFNLSLVRVWNLDDQISTVTSVDFVVPATAATVAVQVGSTTDMIQGRPIFIDSDRYTIVSIDSGVQVTVRNVDAPVGATIFSGAPVTTSRISFLTNIALGANGNGIAWDDRFRRILVGVFALSTVVGINPNNQTIECTLGMGLPVRFTTLGNSGCKAFIPLDTRYGVII